MPRPCHQMHPRLEPGNCRLCWLYVNNDRYRELWSGEASKFCKHLGEPTGQEIKCKSCTGNVRVRTYDCARHGVCTTNFLIQQVACCRICPDKEPSDG